MINENFLELIKQYLSQTKESKNSQSIIKEDTLNETDNINDYLEKRIKVFTTLLEYYLSLLSFQKNIETVDEITRTKLQEKYTDLLESYVSLYKRYIAPKIKTTILDKILKENEIVKQYLTENNLEIKNSDKLIINLGNSINKVIENIYETKYKELKENMEKQIRDNSIKLNESEIEKLLTVQILEELIDNLLLDKVNRYIIESKIETMDNDNELSEIFEEESINKDKLLYEEYKKRLRDFCQLVIEYIYK